MHTVSDENAEPYSDLDVELSRLTPDELAEWPDALRPRPASHTPSDTGQSAD